MGGKFVVHVGRGAGIRGRAAFILQRDIDGVDVSNGLLVAGVMGALEHLEIQQGYLPEVSVFSGSPLSTRQGRGRAAILCR
jgi:hypothetical protein